jgi:hypothetical protein
MRAARMFNGIREVRVEWNIMGQRVRVMAATAMVMSLAVGTLIMWTVNPVAGLIVAGVLLFTVLWFNMKINSMSELDTSGLRADLGEWTQLQLLWTGSRHPVVLNNGLQMSKKNREG